MQSEFISKPCFAMQLKIDSGIIDIEDLYVELIKKFQKFLSKLEEFADKQSNNNLILNKNFILINRESKSSEN